MYKPPEWDPGTRTDIIQFDPVADAAELSKHIQMGESISTTTCSRVLSVIQTYWDCFCEDGARRPILGYEFSIDTGGSPPVCCSKVRYRPHESKIIVKQLDALLHNKWIRECGGPWGSTIVLPPKPYQETINDIEAFVWRLCVSYHKLNTVTLPFEYPIPRCDDAIEDLGDGAGRLHFISLDARQGYHQVSVRLCDQEKLAFFGSDGKKYTFTVMPFGPRNAPAFYTAMMRQFQEE
eukprot:scaffold85103_cov48-Attheya_sp.AAC.3